MGLSSKKTTVTNKPVFEKQILGASDALTNTFNQQAPRINGIANGLTDLLPEMQRRFTEGNRGVNAAQDHNVSVLNGDFLNGNPFLEQMIAQTNNNVSNTLGASLNKLGVGPAGTTFQGLQTRELAKNELGTRFANFNNERDRQTAAAGQSAGLANAETAGVLPLLATAELGANLPLNAASQFAAGQGGLLGQFQTQTQKKSGGLLGDLLGAGLSGFASGGFG